MEPFRFCLALAPVAVYLLLLGAINLSRRPVLVRGTRDAAALGLAVSGLVIVGPVELFFPQAAAIRFGPYVWVLLVACYGLCLVLVVLLLRPRLIIYNISVDQLRAILVELAPQLDPAVRWAGDSAALPDLGVQFHIESLSAMRNVSLAAVGPQQNHPGWRHLELALADALRRVKVGRNPRGPSLVAAGLLMLATLLLVIAHDPEAVARGLLEMLQAF